MMNTINLKKGNRLWRFYCKYYTLNGQEVPLPKNLCRFWWIAVSGFIIWIIDEVKILYLWGVMILTTLIVAALISLTPEGGNIFWKTLAVPVLGFWTLSLVFSLVAPAMRVLSFIEKKAPWIIYTVGGVLIIVVLGMCLADGEMRGEIFKIFGIACGVMLAIVAILGILYYGVPYLALLVPDRFLDGAQGSFRTSVAFLKAKKRRVCPLVNPPEGF